MSIGVLRKAKWTFVWIEPHKQNTRQSNPSEIERFHLASCIRLVYLLLLIVLFGALIRTKKLMEYLSFCLLWALLNASQIPMIDFLAFIPFSVLVLYLNLNKAMVPIYLKSLTWSFRRSYNAFQHVFNRNFIHVPKHNQ